MGWWAQVDTDLLLFWTLKKVLRLFILAGGISTELENNPSLPYPRFSSISFTSTPRNLWHSLRGLRGTEAMQESGEVSHCLARFLFLRLAPRNIIARLKADCMTAK